MITKREQIAAMCLQGMLANAEEFSAMNEVQCAKQAIALADALIAELNKAQFEE